MTIRETQPTVINEGSNVLELRHLRLAELRQLDDCLAEVGSYGEVRLIIAKGRISFVEIVKSRRIGESR